MYLFGIVVLILTFLMTLLRRKLRARNAFPLPKNFAPDYGKSDKKLEKKRKKWQKHRAKKLEEERAKEAEKSGGFFENFDKEMEYIQAKKELERKHRIRKPSKYEGAFALCELRRQERERKAVLAKMRKEIFERQEDGNEETKKNSVNVAEKYVPKTETSELRKRNLAENTVVRCHLSYEP